MKKNIIILSLTFCQTFLGWNINFIKPHYNKIGYALSAGALLKYNFTKKDYLTLAISTATMYFAIREYLTLKDKLNSVDEIIQANSDINAAINAKNAAKNNLGI